MFTLCCKSHMQSLTRNWGCLSDESPMSQYDDNLHISYECFEHYVNCVKE